MKHEMCETCSTHWSVENVYKILIGKSENIVRSSFFWVVTRLGSLVIYRSLGAIDGSLLQGSSVTTEKSKDLTPRQKHETRQRRDLLIKPRLRWECNSKRNLI